AVRQVVPAVLAVPTAFPDDVPTHGGQHRCPHCRQPLAIISVVIPADAAVVRPPEVPHNAYTSANLNPSPGEDDLATLGNFDERPAPPPPLHKVPDIGPPRRPRQLRAHPRRGAREYVSLSHKGRACGCAALVVGIMAFPAELPLPAA